MISPTNSVRSTSTPQHVRRHGTLGGPRFGRRPAHRKRVDLRVLDSESDASRRSSSTVDHEHFGAQRDSVVSAGAVVSALFGVTLGGVLVGLNERIPALFGVERLAYEPVLAAALLAVAVGVRVPQRLTTYVCAVAWHRFVRRGTPSAISSVLINRGEADRPLYWTVLSVVALVVGISVALLPLMMGLAATTYEWLMSHFVWPEAFRPLIQVAVASAIAVVPLALVGLAVSCAHHLSCRYGRWNTVATGWLLIGTSLGVVAYHGMASRAVPSDLSLMASSLPAFLVSILSASVIATRSAKTETDVRHEREWLPVWSDRRPTLLRAGIVVVGGGSACAAVSLIALLERTTVGPTTALATILSALGVGMFCGSTVLGSSRRSIGSFGGACVCTSLILVVAVTVWGRVGGAMRSGSVLVIAYVALAAIGYATAAGRQALMNSVASRSSEGSKMMGRLLVCAAATILGTSFVLRWVDAMDVLLILAMVLVLLGVTLMMLEPTYSIRTRRIRMISVVVVVAATVALVRSA